MHQFIRSLLHNGIYYTFIIGGILFVWGFLPQLGLSLSSPQTTTITITITGSLSGTIQPLDTNLVFYSGIYRTTTTIQPVTVSSNLASTYTLSGDLTNIITGSITPPSLIHSSPLVLLLPGDGVKIITTEIESLDTMSGGAIYLPPLQFGIDTTPPSLPLTITGPDRVVKRSELLSFAWNVGFDGGSGIERYVIQLSQEAHFPTAIEFSSTGTNISLAGNSIETKKRFWRLGIIDRVGNTIYSPAQFFVYQGQGGDTSSLDNHLPSEQTPINDQCNGPDLSNNFFDGLCTPLITFPELVLNTPEHQAPDTRPFIDKLHERLSNDPLKAYVFPAYDTPHAYTIYEYPEELVYNDIYESEDREENSGIPVIVYNPRLGVKKQINTENTYHSVAGITINDLGNKYDYLYLWYQITPNSCAGIMNYCPVEPMCLDAKTGCYFDELICLIR